MPVSWDNKLSFGLGAGVTWLVSTRSGRWTGKQTAKGLWGLSNIPRFGSATASMGVGQLAAGVGGGVALGLGTLVAGTYLAESSGLVQKGSTDHALDFATGKVDHWYDYTIHYNAYKITKHYFDRMFSGG